LAIKKEPISFEESLQIMRANQEMIEIAASNLLDLTRDDTLPVDIRVTSQNLAKGIMLIASSLGQEVSWWRGIEKMQKDKYPKGYQ
jgi:hypothetical protein